MTKGWRRILYVGVVVAALSAIWKLLLLYSLINEPVVAERHARQFLQENAPAHSLERFSGPALRSGGSVINHYVWTRQNGDKFWSLELFPYDNLICLYEEESVTGPIRRSICQNKDGISEDIHPLKLGPGKTPKS